MSYRQQINERGQITGYKDMETGELVSAKDFERRQQMQAMMQQSMPTHQPQLMANPQAYSSGGAYGAPPMLHPQGQMIDPTTGGMAMQPQMMQGAPMQMGGGGMMPIQQGGFMPMGTGMPPMQQPQGMAPGNPLIQPGAQMISPQANVSPPGLPQAPGGQMAMAPEGQFSGHSTIDPTQGRPPTAGKMMQGKSLRLEGIPHAHPQQSLHTAGGSTGTGVQGHSAPRRSHGFLDATSIAILLPTLVLLALIIAAAHKKRLFPWQTIRTFNPPSGMMTPKDYERSYLCPPNLRRHGRLGKRNPEATWEEADGVVVPFGFLARTHLPITIPMGRLPNKNMFIVAPSGSGKTTLMRAIIKSLMAKPCVVIALEAKANDPNLDEKKEGFKYTVLPEAQQAGFEPLYFNPLDNESVHWNPLDCEPIQFASSIVQDVNSLDAEEQHWAERDMGYIEGLAQLLKWGAVQVIGEDENGQASELEVLPCNPRGLMKLVNNRRNIVESLRQMKNNPNVNTAELSEMTQRLSSIIRTDADWDKNIQGVRGRLRMFKNVHILRVTEQSNIDMHAAMHKPTVLIFGAPASLGPDAESLAGTFVYQLQQALHTRYGTVSVLPLFAFFDEYQTLNIDLAGRLSAIVRGANGGLTVILQNISQIASGSGKAAEAELRTIFSNSAIRVCLHNADEQTALFFSEEIGKHAVIVPGIADHYQSTGFGIFPSSWNRIHSQQVVARVDSDTIKRMEKHHALVYLAPAGDPEFGESKPLMVDLRGIEEIARLHLLHNVTVRRSPSTGAPIPGQPAPQAVPSFMQVQSPADAINSAFSGDGQNQHHQMQASNPQSQPQNRQAPSEPPLTGAPVGQIAQAVTQGVQSVIGQLFGKPKPELEVSETRHFAQIPQGAAEFADAGRVMTHTAGAFGAASTQSGSPVTTPGFVSASTDEFGSLHAASRIAAEVMDKDYSGVVQPTLPTSLGAMGTTLEGAASQSAFAAAAASQPAATSAATSAASSADRVCQHCGKFAGKGKFCIECGQFIGAQAAAAPAASEPIAQLTPSMAMAQPVSSEPAQQDLSQQPQVVGPLGSRGKDSGRPQPRYGGLAVTNRDSLPSKRASVVENAQQMAGSNPYQSPVDPRLADGTGGIPGAGPLSQRVAIENLQNNNPYQRNPVTSLNPDVSKFGFNQPTQQPNNKGGVEF